MQVFEMLKLFKMVFKMLQLRIEMFKEQYMNVRSKRTFVRAYCNLTIVNTIKNGVSDRDFIVKGEYNRVPDTKEK